MSKRRWFAKGAGCLAGVSLSGALGIAGTLGLLGVGGWVAYRAVTSQWEDALRDTLAQTTGEEIEFGKMSIGLRSVTVHDLIVTDSADGTLLRIDQLSLQGDPRELLGAPTAWHLDGLHLEGVALRPRRQGEGFALPQTTLALLRGDTPLPAALALPKLVVPEITAEDVSIELDGHRLDIDDALVAEGAELTLPTGDGTTMFTARLGAAELTGVHIGEPDLRVDRALLALTTDLTPDTTLLPVGGLVLEGVQLKLDGLTAMVPRVQAENEVVLDLTAGPSLSVGTLQSDGFSLTAGNVFHCRDLKLRVDQPLTLADEEVQVEDLVITGLRSQTTRAGWPALEVLLSATEGARLPPTRAPRVTFRQTEVAAGKARATAESTTTSLDFQPGQRLAWGPGTVRGLQVELDGSEQLIAEQVDVSGGALRPGGAGLAFERLGVQGVKASSAWTGDAFGLPDGLLGLSAVKGGMTFGEVAVSGLDIDVTGRSGSFPVRIDAAAVSGLSLKPAGVTLGAASAEGVRLKDGAFEATVRHVEVVSDGVSLVPGEQLSWGALDVRGVSLSGGGEASLAIERLDVPGGRLAPDTDKLVFDTIAVEGVTGTLAWGAHAFGVPKAVFRLGGFAGGVDVARAQIQRADLRVRGKTGSIPVHLDRVVAEGLSVTDEGWTISTGSLSGLDASWERVRATVQTAQLGADGTVSLQGTEAWTRLNDQRQLDLPPVAADHAPVWLGGQYRGTEPYFGVAFPGSPYTPRAIVIPDLVLHLADEGIANPHTTWDLPLDVTLGPHDAQGHLPLTVDGTFAGGKLTVEGHLEPAGVIQADFGVRGLVLGEMGMYLDEPMSRFSMQIKQGRGGAALRMNLEGSKVSMRGTGSGRSLKMQGSALAGVANSGFRAVKGGDNTVSIPIELDGDLSDPAFSPFDLLLSSYVGGLHKSVAKSLGKAVKGIGGPQDGTARAKQTGGGRNVDKAFGALKKALDGGSSDAVRAGKTEPDEEEKEGPPAKLLDTAADTGRPEAVDTGKE